MNDMPGKAKVNVILRDESSSTKHGWWGIKIDELDLRYKNTRPGWSF